MQRVALPIACSEKVAARLNKVSGSPSKASSHTVRPEGIEMVTRSLLAGAAALFVAGAAVSGCGRGIYVGEKAPIHGEALPLQDCPGPLRGDRMKIKILPGVYQCDIVIIGQRNRVRGYGWKKTVIDGRLIIEGDSNSIGGLRVLGETIVAGHSNKLRKNHYDDQVIDDGHNNSY